MRKYPHLSQGVRDGMLSALNDQQRTFLESFLKRGKRTIFGNVLAKEKAGNSSVAEEFAEQWELLDYIDAGPDWRTESSLFCECGRQLRCQYVIKNNETEELKRFGITHFEEHTGIPPQLALQIKKGMTSIDYELDEILTKLEEGWELADEGIEHIPDEIHMPSDIQNHMDHGIPLLDRQLIRLNALIATKQAEVQLKAAAERERRAIEERMKRNEQEVLSQSILANRKEELATSDWWSEVQGNTDLELKWQLGAILCIKELDKQEFLASEITKTLVTRYGAPRDTYPTGKFKIYPYVCLFLGYLTQLKKLQFIEKKVNMDRVYKVVDPFLLDNETLF